MPRRNQKHKGTRNSTPKRTSKSRQKPKRKNSKSKNNRTVTGSQALFKSNVSVARPSVSGIGDVFRLTVRRIVCPVATNADGVTVYANPPIAADESSAANNCFFVCPQLFAGHDYLSEIYEQVSLIGNVTIRYLPNIAVTTNGLYGLYVDPRYLAAVDERPTSINDVSARSGVAISPVYQTTEVSYTPNRMEKLGAAPTNQDTQFSFRSDHINDAAHNQTICYCFATGLLGAFTIGYLEVSYTVEYSSRKL